MNTTGGEVVKFEFDPTVAARLHEHPDDRRGSKAGDTVRVAADAALGIADDLLMPAGSVFRYIGPDIVGPALAVRPGLPDATKWEVTSEPWGYVDYANNRICVFNTDNEAATGSSSPRTRSITRRAAAPASAGSMPGNLRRHRARGRPDHGRRREPLHQAGPDRAERDRCRRVGVRRGSHRPRRPVRHQPDARGATTNNRTFDSRTSTDDTITLRRCRQHLRARPGGDLPRAGSDGRRQGRRRLRSGRARTR